MTAELPPLRSEAERGRGTAGTAVEGAKPPPPSHAVSPLRPLRVHLARSAGEEASLPVEGYASLFWTRDLADDVVAKGAFAESLGLAAGPLKMLHAHDTRAPIGVWDEAGEDARGLYVKGRILTDTPGGRLAQALVKAGALDGLSIGFRTRRARSDGRLRVLSAVDLQEVSLVSFPMLPGARLARR